MWSLVLEEEESVTVVDIDLEECINFNFILKLFIKHKKLSIKKNNLKNNFLKFNNYNKKIILL